MPEVSKAQMRAMHAAAEGRSTLGIPKNVGKDFVAAGPASSRLPNYLHRRKMARMAKEHARA